MFRSVLLFSARLTAFFCLGILLLPLNQARAGQSIRVVAESWPPYCFEKDGKVTGAMADVVRAALQQAGIAAGIEIMEWTSAYSTARDNKNVLIFSLLRLPEREKLFSWIGPVMEAPLTYLLFRAAHKKVHAKSVDDVKKLRTAVTHSDALVNAMVKAGFSQRTNMLTCNSEEKCVQALLSGRADLYGRSAGMGKKPPEKTALVREFDLPDAWLYMAFSADTPKETVNRVQAGLDRVLGDGTVLRILKEYNLQ